MLLDEGRRRTWVFRALVSVLLLKTKTSQKQACLPSGPVNKSSFSACCLTGISDLRDLSIAKRSPITTCFILQHRSNDHMSLDCLQNKHYVHFPCSWKPLVITSLAYYSFILSSASFPATGANNARLTICHSYSRPTNRSRLRWSCASSCAAAADIPSAKLAPTSAGLGERTNKGWWMRKANAKKSSKELKHYQIGGSLEALMSQDKTCYRKKERRIETCWNLLL